jgi:hypothetical protein
MQPERRRKRRRYGPELNDDPGRVPYAGRFGGEGCDALMRVFALSLQELSIRRRQNRKVIQPRMRAPAPEAPAPDVSLIKMIQGLPLAAADRGQRIRQRQRAGAVAEVGGRLCRGDAATHTAGAGHCGGDPRRAPAEASEPPRAQGAAGPPALGLAGAAGASRLRNVSMSLRRTASADRVSHSQKTTTRHPAASRLARTLASRATLPSNFFRQKSGRVLGVAARRQSWRCQKHPCTKTTVLHLGNTMSGRPGNFFE